MLFCEILEEKQKEGKHSVYGLRFFKEDGETVRLVSDVFTDRDKAFAFQTLINQSDLDEVHISDAIEDALGT